MRERRSRTEQRYEFYRAARKQEYDLLNGACQRLDQAMLTLPAGAFALSITFMKDIATHPVNQHLLVYGWYCFVGALGLSLISLIASQKSFISTINDLDKAQRGETGTTGKGFCSWATEYLNYFTVAVFLIGLVFTAAFAQSNLPK